MTYEEYKKLSPEELDFIMEAVPLRTLLQGTPLHSIPYEVADLCVACAQQGAEGRKLVQRHLRWILLVRRSYPERLQRARALLVQNGLAALERYGDPMLCDELREYALDTAPGSAEHLPMLGRISRRASNTKPVNQVCGSLSHGLTLLGRGVEMDRSDWNNVRSEISFLCVLGTRKCTQDGEYDSYPGTEQLMHAWFGD